MGTEKLLPRVRSGFGENMELDQSILLTFLRTERVTYRDTDGVKFAYDNFIFSDEKDELWDIRSIVYSTTSRDYEELTLGTLKVVAEIRTWGALTPEELTSRFNDACSSLYREMW